VSWLASQVSPELGTAQPQLILTFIGEFISYDDDDPWMAVELKQLDRKRKRELYKHKQSNKWTKLNE
jgi:hypothetical protein